MSEGAKGRCPVGFAASTKTFPSSSSRGRVVNPIKRCSQISSKFAVNERTTSRVLSELPVNHRPQKATALTGSQSKSNSDISGFGIDRKLTGKAPSSENVSRSLKTSKIPRATSVRKINPEPFTRSGRCKSTNDVSKTGKKLGRTVAESNGGLKKNLICLDNIPGPSHDVAAPVGPLSPFTCEECDKTLLGNSESSSSKRSSGDFDVSFGPISDDDELVEVSKDVTIRKEALDIAVKLASRTSASFEESSTLGFSELAMLDMLGASDLNLSVPKSDLSFTILEDMDNITSLNNAIDRAPSMEDLPMDYDSSCTIHGLEPVTSARSPSPIEELPLSSRTPNAPVSIITSITSIMSLDTGYQGDGELSRPESRSAEVDPRLKIPNAENGVQIKSIQFDDAKTMTDSDFFTESDADVHDDLSAAAAEIGSGKGDRRAQVIDGTLYGGVNMRKHSFNHFDNENRSGCVENANANFLPNGSSDDMASSGIFSDVDKKSDVGSNGNFEKETLKISQSEMEHSESLQAPNGAVHVRKGSSDGSEGMVKSSSAESSSTIQETTSTVVRTSSPASNAQDSDKAAQKWNRNMTTKNKMPNRNVTSKVKVLIESSQSKPETRPKIARKGKWDAVMDRIAQGKEENKFLPTRFRDVKSKVYQSTKPQPTTIVRNEDAENKKSQINNLQAKARSRRNVRVRSSESPLVSSKTSRKSTSANSSQRSSISDISVSAVNKQQQRNDSSHNGIPAKSASATIINSLSNNNNINGNKHKVKTLKMVQKKSSPVVTRSKESVLQKNGTVNFPAKDKSSLLLKEMKHNSRAFETFAVLLGYCINDLDAFSTPALKQRLDIEKQKCTEAETRVEELGRQIQEQLKSKTRIIEDLEEENMALREKADELRLLIEDLRNEEANLKNKLILFEEELRNKIKEREDIEKELSRENAELVCKLEEAHKIHGVLKKLYEKIKLELTAARQENAKSEGRQRKDSSPDSSRNGRCNQSHEFTPDRLESEVESLRQVLALKTDEVSELRRQELFLRENADRVPKLVSTITLLEGKVEDFQTQLSSQTEINRDLEKRNYLLEEELKMTNVQKVRLTQKNEELQYKLRQYAEALRQLVNEKNLTEDDIRNAYIYPKTPQKGDCSLLVDSLPAQMKGVVQKSDSVSYMLEMTEGSSEIVTNIIRRAESLRYSSRSQTLPKKKRPKTYSVSSMDALSPFDYYSGDKPSSSRTKFTFEKTPDSGKTPTNKKKIVKLDESDFVPNSIELPDENRCEIIEITKSFDRETKPDELAHDMSLSSCSSSSENGNEFDIESDIYGNGTETADVELGSKVRSQQMASQYDTDESAEDTEYREVDKKDNYFGNAPKTSGGEALIASGEESHPGSP